MGCSVEVGAEPPSSAGTALAGKVFVLTGALQRMTRSEAKSRIAAAGGKVTGSVSGKTDYLVVGEHPGSKYQHALDLGVTILDEERLIVLLDQEE